MRRLAMACLALATMWLGAAPVIAHAQGAAPAITKEQRDKGMKDAPAAVQKAGLDCTVTDAYFLGQSSGADKSDIYEVACKQGLGYVVLTGKEPKAYDCLATASQKTLACRLPANADPKQGLKGYIASSGSACTLTNARYIGSNPTTSVYEVACQEGPGFILQTAAPGGGARPVTVIPCIQASGSMACTLTSKAQNDAYLAGLVAKSGRTCTVSGSRYMGSEPSGIAYYEVGCGSQSGFVVAANKAGAYDHVLSCGQAQQLSGGCQLTSAAQLAAEDTGNYTRMAKAGGFDCTVSKDRVIGLDSHHNEVVELACSNRPDGVVAVFPATPGGRAQFVDCVASTQFGPNGACTLTSSTPIYAKYTAALAAKGRTTCQVSNARYLGRNPGGSSLIETACADGKPGWVLEVTPTYQATQVFSCGQAKASGLTCELPTNVKG